MLGPLSQYLILVFNFLAFNFSSFKRVKIIGSAFDS